MGSAVAIFRVARGLACWGDWAWTDQAVGGLAGGGCEQVHPCLVVMPAFAQVRSDVHAAVAGDAGGDVREADSGWWSDGTSEAAVRPGQSAIGELGSHRLLRNKVASSLPWEDVN